MTTPEPEQVASITERHAKLAHLCASADQKLSDARIAAEQAKTAAIVAHERAVAAARQAVADEDAEISGASSRRALEAIKGAYIAVIADGFSPFACQRMAHLYVKLNTEHLRVTGKPLNRELALAVADRHIAGNPNAAEALACFGVLTDTNAFGSSIADRADAARRALLNPSNPIAIRDALAVLDGAIAETGAHGSPRMPATDAKKRWTILMLCSEREAALIREHEEELAQPAREAKARLEELTQRAGAGDEDAINALALIPHALERAAQRVRGFGDRLPNRLREAVGW